jgi:hypothetical protein
MKSRATPRDEREFVVPWQLPPEPEILIDLTDPAFSDPTKLVGSPMAEIATRLASDTPVVSG